MPRHPETEANRERNTRLISAREGRLSPDHHRQPMSRSEFADAVNAALSTLYPDRKNLASFYVDYRWVGKLERGEHHWASTERRAALRHLTGAATDRELGLYKPRNPERLTLTDAAIRTNRNDNSNAVGDGTDPPGDPGDVTPEHVTHRRSGTDVAVVLSTGISNEERNPDHASHLGKPDPPAVTQELVQHPPETSGAERGELLLRAVLVDAGSGDAFAPSIIVAAADQARRMVDDLLDDGTPRIERIELIEQAVHDHAVDALTVLPHEMLRRLMLDFLDAQHLIRTCRDVARLRRIWAVLAKIAILTVDEMSVLGKVAVGRAWLATAITAAAKADLRSLEADVHALGAMLSLYHAAPAEASQVARKSVALTDGTVCVATGLAPMLDALALAKLRQRAAAKTALHSAQRAYDLTRDTERADSVFGFSPRRRLFYEGRLLTMIGDYHAAGDAHRQALDLYPEHVVGDRTIIALDRATALINSNEPDTAAQLIETTLSALPPGHRSYLFIDTAEHAIASAPPRAREHRRMNDCRDMLTELKRATAA